MAYRNLTFRSLAADIRTERYLGEDHIVIPCIALVGDEVVYGMNADGPEFIPAEELEFSTLGWSGRPVLYDHPSNSISTANEPATLEAMSFGQIFHPRFEDNKLKVEAWCSKRRALDIGQDDLIEAIENGEVIELSVGAIISLDKTPGIAPNGKRFDSRWYAIQSDHLAIGLSGSQGACNIEMGCGANRLMSGGKKESNPPPTFPKPPAPNGPPPIPNADYRTMRANRGVDTMPDKSKPALPALDIKPRSLKDRILSLASQAFRSLTADEGLSDKELRDKLWDQLYAVEPAFYGIENVYQESSTVTYITSPDKKLHMWRRTFTNADDGVVTLGDDREEIGVTEFYYMYLGENPTTTMAAQVDSDKPCGCSKTLANDTNTDTNDTNQPKEDTEMPDDNKPKTDATPPASDTPAATPPVPTPEKGSSEAATPSQSGGEDKTIPNYPAGEPNPTGETLTEEQQIEKLPAPLRAMVKSYQERDRREKESLVGALSKSQKVFTKAQLEAKATDELRQLAELAGVGGVGSQPQGDFSGRMMVSRESELPPPPDPHGVNKYLKRNGGDTAN